MAEYIDKEDTIRKIVETSVNLHLDPLAIGVVIDLIMKMPSKEFTDPVKRHTNKGEL